MSQLEPRQIKTANDDDLLMIPEARYQMSTSTKNYSNVYTWVAEHPDDPAFKVNVRQLLLCKRKTHLQQNFILQLKNHILGHLQGKTYEGDEQEFMHEDWRTIHFTNNRIYHHKTVRLNYTTYELWRDQDSINPDQHPNIMLTMWLYFQEGRKLFPLQGMYFG